MFSPYSTTQIMIHCTSPAIGLITHYSTFVPSPLDRQLCAKNGELADTRSKTKGNNESSQSMPVKILTVKEFNVCLTLHQEGAIKKRLRKEKNMDLTLNWLAEIWKSFSLWTSTQPTFVQVAFGIGLFYLVLQSLRLLYRFVYFTLSGLMAGRGRPKIKKDFKPPSRPKKHVTIDDEAPPFVFR